MIANIPKHQQIPPAGFEHELAYRPACSQLKPAGDGDNTGFFVIRGDGERIALATLPTKELAQNLKTLGDWGLCKPAGEIVPLISPQDAIATLSAPMPTVEAVTPPFPWGGVGLTLLVGGAIAAAAIVINRRPAPPSPWEI